MTDGCRNVFHAVTRNRRFKTDDAKKKWTTTAVCGRGRGLLLSVSAICPLPNIHPTFFRLTFLPCRSRHCETIDGPVWSSQKKMLELSADRLLSPSRPHSHRAKEHQSNAYEICFLHTSIAFECKTFSYSASVYKFYYILVFSSLWKWRAIACLQMRRKTFTMLNLRWPVVLFFFWSFSSFDLFHVPPSNSTGKNRFSTHLHTTRFCMKDSRLVCHSDRQIKRSP